MSKLRVHNFLVSLDGYSTGGDQSTSAAFGHAQTEFRIWFERCRMWRGLEPDGNVGAAEGIASMWEAGIGAMVMGRNHFRPTTGPWPDDGWRGWWGEEPPFRTPVFVLTHWQRPPLVVGHTTFHFISGTPAEILKRARDAAGALDVRVGGGPTTVNEFVAADLVDHFHVIQVPILLGRGVPLWDGLESLHERYAVESFTLPSGATHLFFTRP